MAHTVLPVEFKRVAGALIIVLITTIIGRMLSGKSMVLKINIPPIVPSPGITPLPPN